VGGSAYGGMRLCHEGSVEGARGKNCAVIVQLTSEKRLGEDSSRFRYIVGGGKTR